MGDADEDPLYGLDRGVDTDWRWAWEDKGPYADEFDSETTSDERKKEIAKAIENWKARGGIDWCYGYTRHVAYIIVKFAMTVLPKTEYEGVPSESKIGTREEARIKALDALDSLVAADKFNYFDRCVLPIRERRNGTIPRAFLGSDVLESGEGLGFKKNRLSRYLRHPAVVPKSQLQNWATYSAKGTRVFNRFNSWFYSIKYDGYSAIWTGTQLVTANGRQPIYTMPERMRECLSSIRMPLIGELIVVQEPNATKYVTKEALQAVVHTTTPPNMRARAVASRMAFMVYDTPATNMRNKKFSDRLTELEQALVRYVDGQPRQYSIKGGDHVELVKQYPVAKARSKYGPRTLIPGKRTATIETTLSAALLAATATEHEGLMLTPNEPYLQLFTENYRRVKLKLLFQFSLKPTVEPSSWWYPVANATGEIDEVQGELDQIQPMRSARVEFRDAHGDMVSAKINIENDVWFDSGSFKDRPFHVRLAKHRWGFHLLYTREATAADDTTRSIAIDNYAAFVRPTLVGDFVTKYALETGLLDNAEADITDNADPDGVADLYALFSARLMHSKVLAQSGRPHYPAHPKPAEEDEVPFGVEVKTITGPFLGEASTTDVRNLVREASMMAEHPNFEPAPYNEWLCYLHRAYESADSTSKASLWTDLVSENAELHQEREKIKGYYTQRLHVLPGEPITYYVRDYEHPHLTDGARYVIYKLRVVETAPSTFSSIYEPVDAERAYFVPNLGISNLPPRVSKLMLEGELTTTLSYLIPAEITSLALQSLFNLCRVYVAGLKQDTAYIYKLRAAKWEPKISFNWVMSLPSKERNVDAVQQMVSKAKNSTSADASAIPPAPAGGPTDAFQQLDDKYKLVQFRGLGLPKVEGSRDYAFAENETINGKSVQAAKGYDFFLAQIEEKPDGSKTASFKRDNRTTTIPSPPVWPNKKGLGATGKDQGVILEFYAENRLRSLGNEIIDNYPEGGLTLWGTDADIQEGIFTMQNGDASISVQTDHIWLVEVLPWRGRAARKSSPPQSSYQLFYRDITASFEKDTFKKLSL